MINNVNNYYTYKVDVLNKTLITGDFLHIGISINNHKQCGYKLESLLAWATTKYKSIQINVNDSIDAYNIQFNENISFDDALEKAHKNGKVWVEANKHILEMYPSIPVFHYEELKQPFPHEFKMKELEYLYDNDNIFKELIDLEIGLFLKRRQAKEGEWAEEKKQSFAKYSKLYILDELALMSLLNENKEFIEVYAGRFLNIIKDPKRLEIKNLPKGLINYPLIEVDFIRRKNSNTDPDMNKKVA